MNNVAYYLTTPEGLTVSICACFVIGFVIGIGCVMKRIVDYKKQIKP